MRKLYFNGEILTVDENKPEVEAVLVKDGKIEKVGSKEELLALADESTEKIDLNGKVMMPGFIDPHSHFAMVCKLALLENLSPPPIGDCATIDDILNKLKAAYEKFPERGAIMGMGYDNYQLKERRHLNKFDLDKISTEKPIIAIHASGHVGAINSKALELFGYTSETPDMDGGLIGRVDGTNEPNGYIEEAALIAPILKILPKPTPESLKLMAQKGQETYTKNGITTAQDGLSSNPEYDLFKALTDLGSVEIDVHCYPALYIPNGWKDGSLGIKPGEKLGRFKFSGFKAHLDGSPQARTAWMSQPYLVVEEGDDPEYRGYGMFEDDKIVTDWFIECLKGGHQLLVHTNGDEASAQFIRCYKKALEVQKPKNEIRAVVVHAQTTRTDQLDEMKELGIYPTFFSSHTFFWGDDHIRNFGIERASVISNLRHSIDIGLSCTDHNDSPILPPNVIFSMWTACNRVTRSGRVLGEDRRITPMEALKVHTINAAFQYFEEDTKGSITEGKLADFVIVDKNILKIDPNDIKDVKILETIKEGKTIYKNTL